MSARYAHAFTLPTVRAVAATGNPAARRSHTRRMLRQYDELRNGSGATASVLGCRSYRTQGLDNAMIFLHDFDRCLQQLAAEERNLLLGMTEGTNDPTRDLNLPPDVIVDRYLRALDKLTAILQQRGLLSEANEKKGWPPTSIQRKHRSYAQSS